MVRYVNEVNYLCNGKVEKIITIDGRIVFKVVCDNPSVSFKPLSY